jgi:hypothetical protein
VPESTAHYSGYAAGIGKQEHTQVPRYERRAHQGSFEVDWTLLRLDHISVEERAVVLFSGGGLSSLAMLRSVTVMHCLS